jgi:hypothetical protein
VQTLAPLTAPAVIAPQENGGDQAQAGPASEDVGQALNGLPAASTRSLKDNDMARNFMINSINAIIGQNMRISLIHDIFHADSTEKLREVYFAWESSMANTTMGAKRLPELRVKLFKVL